MHIMNRMPTFQPLRTGMDMYNVQCVYTCIYTCTVKLLCQMEGGEGGVGAIVDVCRTSLILNTAGTEESVISEVS